jgi:predicted GIY-YIG superfamily endonuclease
MYHVYALVDPRDSKTRYIGVTKSPKSRFDNHCYGSTQSTRKWAKDLKALGLRPVMIVLQLCPTPQQAALAEEYWIRHFFGLKAALLNNRSKRGGLRGTCVLYSDVSV